ncbi:hypothetical protein RJT34_13010 [Clitoria ternatea]|uniref:Uncharacterized protein n=1 Tax=Clitoria ternatea TaxID=43366 RepID=A0AAN9JMS7_CLITE
MGAKAVLVAVAMAESRALEQRRLKSLTRAISVSECNKGFYKAETRQRDIQEMVISPKKQRHKFMSQYHDTEYIIHYNQAVLYLPIQVARAPGFEDSAISP